MVRGVPSTPPPRPPDAALTWCANAPPTDVINVSGHRLSTAEIESALITHAGVAETAGVFAPEPFYRSRWLISVLLCVLSYPVVGTADELTGQAVYSFVTLKP